MLTLISAMREMGGGRIGSVFARCSPCFQSEPPGPIGEVFLKHRGTEESDFLGPETTKAQKIWALA